MMHRNDYRRVRLVLRLERPPTRVAIRVNEERDSIPLTDPPFMPSFESIFIAEDVPVVGLVSPPYVFLACFNNCL